MRKQMVTRIVRIRAPAVPAVPRRAQKVRRDPFIKAEARRKGCKKSQRLTLPQQLWPRHKKSNPKKRASLSIFLSTLQEILAFIFSPVRICEFRGAFEFVPQFYR